MIRLSRAQYLILLFLALLWILAGFLVYSALEDGDHLLRAALSALYYLWPTFLLIGILRRYGPPDPIEPHFQKHRVEFESSSRMDVRTYRMGAQRLLRSQGPRRHARLNGDIAVFDPRTAQFAVFTSTGKSRTYFIVRRPADVRPTVRDLLFGPPPDYWLPLSQSETLALQQYFQTQGRRPGRSGPRTIDTLLDEWKAVLNEVWYGYPYTEDDYTNDLVLRDMIEDIAELLGEESRAVLRAKIDSWDEGIERVTQVTSRPLHYLFGTIDDVAKPGRWWWDRAPLVVDPAQGWDLDSRDSRDEGRSPNR